MNHQLTDLAHPRARGWGALDTTAFLQSQKDWNLERDYGWNGVEVLFKFNNDMLNPTYEVPWLYEDGCVVLNLDHRPLRAFENIPLTLSSEVEGVLMEAIIRYDVRISIEDFWARMSVLLSLALFRRTLITRRPGMCGHGGIFTPNALTVRRNKFRLKNCVAAWGPKRRGSKNIRKYIEDHMSPADVAANTTGGLHKLSQAEQKEARKPNAGKHNQNAGGWGLPKRGRNDAEEEGPAPKRSRGNRIRKGTSIRSKPRAPTPSAVYAPQTSADAVLDPLLDPRLIDLDGYGPSVLPTDGHRPLPIGAGNGPLGQYVNQYTLPSVDTEMSYQNMFPVPNWPVESPCTQCGSGFDIGNPFGLQGISTNYQQVPSAFIGSMPTPHMECMPSEQQVNPYSDLVYDW